MRRGEIAIVAALLGCGKVAAPSAAPDGGAGTVAITTATGALCVGSGSHAGLKLTIARTGDASDVAVTLDAPAFVSSGDLTIAAADDAGTLAISLDASAPEGTYPITVHAGPASHDLLLFVGPPAGTLDASFATAGVLSLAPGHSVDRAALLPQGPNVLLSLASSLGSPPYVVRVNEAGHVDPTFSLTPSALDAGVYALGARADGTILAATTKSPNGCISFTEMSADGAVGVSRTTGNCAAPATSPDLTLPMCVVERADHGVVLAGELPDCCGFATAFSPDGTADAAFAQVDYLQPKPFIDSVWACALEPSGDLVLANFQGMRILGQDGSTVFDDEAPSAPNGTSLALLSDGTIVEGVWLGDPSHVTSSELLWREPTGKTTHTTALYAHEAPLASATPLALAASADDFVYVLTGYELSRYIATGAATGAVDASFQVASVMSPWSAPSEQTGAAVATDSCGRVVVATLSADGSSGELRRFWP